MRSYGVSRSNVPVSMFAAEVNVAGFSRDGLAFAAEALRTASKRVMPLLATKFTSLAMLLGPRKMKGKIG